MGVKGLPACVPTPGCLIPCIKHPGRACLHVSHVSHACMLVCVPPQPAEHACASTVCRAQDAGEGELHPHHPPFVTMTDGDRHASAHTASLPYVGRGVRARRQGRNLRERLRASLPPCALACVSPCVSMFAKEMVSVRGPRWSLLVLSVSDRKLIVTDSRHRRECGTLVQDRGKEFLRARLLEPFLGTLGTPVQDKGTTERPWI